MSEKPILFSTPMVKAILEGRKTQTRRVMKVQPSEYFNPKCEWYYPIVVRRGGEQEPGEDKIFGAWNIDDPEEGYKCSYGAPGHSLWVRESVFMSGKNFADRSVMRYDFEKGFKGTRKDKDGDLQYVHYFADGDSDGARDYGIKPTPSIHMPRWASRINLEITNIKVERLNDVSEEDAKAEGVDYSRQHPKDAFQALWQTINGKREGCSWTDNPWLWCIESLPPKGV